MSKIHAKLEPFVLQPNKQYTVDGLKDKYEQMEKVCSELDPKHFSSLPDGYTYTAKNYMFPIFIEHTVEFHRGKDDVPRLPFFFSDKPKILSELYNAVEIGGEIYGKNHPDVVKTKDTEKHILKKYGHKILTGGYAQFKKNLVYLEHRGGYAYKKDVVTTADTGNLELKRDCYKWRDGDKVEYYRYRELAPDAPRRVVHFDETVFPDIEETRVGIELEFSSAIKASKRTLLNPDFRKVWKSVHDGSIPDRGTEFVSIPLKYEQLGEITKAIDFAFSNGAKISESCGYHVHVGSPKLDFMGLTSVVLLCQNIEDDLFKLVPRHRQNNEFCRKLDKTFRGFDNVTSNEDEGAVADIFYEDAGTNYERRHTDSKWSVGRKRHYWLSIDRFFRFRNEKEKRTVEFRMHHATENPEEFMEFVLLCYYIVEYALTVSTAKARNSTLHNILGFIRNRRDRKRVENLLVSKKAISV